MPKEVRSGQMNVEGFCMCMSGLSPLRIAKPMYSAGIADIPRNGRN